MATSVSPPPSGLKRVACDDEGHPTKTTKEQRHVEETCHHFLPRHIEDTNESPLTWHRHRHVHLLVNNLQRLSSDYTCLDASRPWLLYWMLNALRLVGHELPTELSSEIVTFLKTCQYRLGGYGGGPGQLAHLATTYAAVNAVSLLDTQEAYDSVDREAIADFLWRMRQKDGSFCMHDGGERDVRGCYCAIVIATTLNLVSPGLFEGTAEFVATCQTYEGGFGAVSSTEAHGGYTFCGVACLVLLGKEGLCDLDAALRWAAQCQMQYEGGFCGRKNKLVDSCYSFWVGAVFPIVEGLLAKSDNLSIDNDDGFVFNEEALVEYLLSCCQHRRGGMVDKPGKHADMYHTCYAFSGLAIAMGNNSLLRDDDEQGSSETLNPLLGVSHSYAVRALTHFNTKSKIIREPSA